MSETRREGRRESRAERRAEAWDFAGGKAGPSVDSLIREVRKMREKLDDVGLKPEAQRGIGNAAASGTIGRLASDTGAKKRVSESLDGFQKTRASLTGKRGE